MISAEQAPRLPAREPNEPASARLRRRRWVGLVGAGLGVVAAIVWLVTVPAVAGGHVVIPLGVVVLAALVARAVALAGFALVGARRTLPAGAPRVARVTHARVIDYVPVVDRVVAVSAAVLPVILVVGWAAVDAPSVAAAAGIGWPAVVGVAMLVLAGLAAVRITARPRPAATEAELAWDDVIRARTLRDLAAAVGLTGAGYGLLLVVVLGVAPTGTSRAAVAAFVALGAAALLITVTPGPGRFRRPRVDESERARP